MINDRTTNLLILSLFLVFGFLGILHHEMWRDELQAWLIARDSHTIPQLFENIRYEKHPFLWYLMLYGLTRLTDNPFSMQVLHLAIAASALAVFLFFSPFTKLQKFLFSFGYFPFYEYAVKSRNYALGVLFVFLLCAFIPERRKKYILMAGLLFLLCQTNVFGLVLAFALGCILIAEVCFDASLRRELSQKKGYIALSLLIFLAGVMISTFQIRPTSEDWSFMASGKGIHEGSAVSAVRKVSQSYLPGGAPPKIKPILGISKTQDFYLACALLVFSIFLFLGKPFVLSWYGLGTFVILLFFFTLYKGQTRHHGNLFILWIACLWIAHYFKRIPLKPQWLNSLSCFFGKCQTPLLFLVLSVHFAAGIQAYFKDWKLPYSPNQEVAKFIKENQLDQMVWVGHEDVVAFPLTAYFRKKIYSLRGDRFGSFVIWGPDRRRGKIAKQEILHKAGKIARHSKKDVLIILSEKLDTMPDSVTKLEQFTNGLSSSEKYYLYVMKYIKTI